MGGTSIADIQLPKEQQTLIDQMLAATNISSDPESTELTDGIKTPHKHDVLCGRGGLTNQHIGNVNFRKLVMFNKKLYASSPKRHKIVVSLSIMESIRRQDPPGRFLQRDGKTGLWYDIGRRKALHKTSQALREGGVETPEGLGSSTHSSATTKKSKKRCRDLQDMTETIGAGCVPCASNEIDAQCENQVVVAVSPAPPALLEPTPLFSTRREPRRRVSKDNDYDNYPNPLMEGIDNSDDSSLSTFLETAFLGMEDDGTTIDNIVPVGIDFGTPQNNSRIPAATAVMDDDDRMLLEGLACFLESSA